MFEATYSSAVAKHFLLVKTSECFVSLDFNDRQVRQHVAYFGSTFVKYYKRLLYIEDKALLIKMFECLLSLLQDHTLIL